MGGAIDDVALQALLGPERLAAEELSSGRRWTYAALDRDIAACAGVLASRGIEAGNRVAALARNTVLLPILHHACARLGAIYVPLNWRLADPELAWMIADVEPALLIGDRAVEGIAPDLSVTQLDAAIAATAPLLTLPFDRETVSLILYTSGTSGRPKGAMLSERAISETAINLGLYGRVTCNSRFLIDSPMFHVIGLVSTVRPPWMNGGAILLSDGFDAPRTLSRIADIDLGVTHYFGVPQMAAMLCAVPGYRPEMLHRLTGFFTGGAPFPAEDVKDFVAQRVPLSHGFGMSECGTFCHTPLDPALVEAYAGSSGLPTPRTQMRVVDDAGQVLPTDAVGELQIRGPNLFSGYWRRAEATAAALTTNGWFLTGDMARIDDRGFLWIVDRKKDMFISGGENVYPAEIEAAVAGLAGLAEAAVIGVADARWGEVGHLAVVGLPGTTLDETAVRLHLDGRLARFKLPKYVTVLDALPRTGSGKVVKAELRTILVPDVVA